MFFTTGSVVCSGARAEAAVCKDAYEGTVRLNNSSQSQQLNFNYLLKTLWLRNQ